MSTSTKSNFVAVAEVLNANVAPLPLVQDFADMFAEENPRFNRALFIAASTKEWRKRRESEERIYYAEVYP